jgi:hypothetical protein
MIQYVRNHARRKSRMIYAKPFADTLKGVRRRRGEGIYGRGEEERRARVRQDFRYFSYKLSLCGADTFLFTLRCRLQIVRLRALHPKLYSASAPFDFDFARPTRWMGPFFAAAVAWCGAGTIRIAAPQSCQAALLSRMEGVGVKKRGWLEWSGGSVVSV